MQFIDLKKQYASIENRMNERIQQVLDHQKFIMGPEVFELEERLADYVGVKHCISCANGTDALIMPLMAYGIGEGDAIFVPAFTFFATAECVSVVGATPVFVDVEEDSFNLDPIKLEQAIEKVVKENKLSPKGIIPVDLFGLSADYESINKIAKKDDLFVLEDAAQSFGGTYRKAKNCSHVDVAATSFFPAKPLGCYGDGGAIFTDNDELAEILQSIRVHGKGDHKYENVRIGLNSRLDTLQAAVLLSKMDIFNEELRARQWVASEYNERLKDFFDVPHLPTDEQCAWAQYTLKSSSSEERDFLMEELGKHGIPTMIYYPKAIHLQEAYTELGYQLGDFPVSEKLSQVVFSLPMHPYLSRDEIERICEALIASKNNL